MRTAKGCWAAVCHHNLCCVVAGAVARLPGQAKATLPAEKRERSPRELVFHQAGNFSRGSSFQHFLSSHRLRKALAQGRRLFTSEKSEFGWKKPRLRAPVDPSPAPLSHGHIWTRMGFSPSTLADKTEAESRVTGAAYNKKIEKKKKE